MEVTRCHPASSSRSYHLFVWLMAGGWCWFVLTEKYCWLAGGMHRWLTHERPIGLQRTITPQVFNYHWSVLIILLIISTFISGQTRVKPRSHPLMSMPVSRTFGAFSKFRLNTSKSANTKVIRRLEGHNFLHWRHSKFWSFGAHKLSQRPFE
jgi:hypothetical protein